MARRSTTGGTRKRRGSKVARISKKKGQHKSVPLAELRAKLKSRTDELKDALEQQVATARVLEVISRSPGELGPVFRAVLDSAIGICHAGFGTLLRYDGREFYFAADAGTPRRLAEYVRRPGPFRGVPGGMVDRILKTRRVQHSADYAAEPSPGLAATLGGARSTLGVPILKDDVLLGALVIYRKEVRPFTKREIALVQSFATQAAIAIENARLFNQTQEALERQAATADILNVINRSSGNLAPVFEAVLEKATLLCEASFGVFSTYLGEDMHQVLAMRSVPPAAAKVLSRSVHLGPETGLGRLVRGEKVVHIHDAADDEGYRRGNPVRRALVDLAGTRTYLAVPLRREGIMLGAFTIYRQEIRPFSEEQIATVQAFADQAAIAIENARLFNETREALERQTATADILKVIASSPSDVQPVFEAIATSANRLLGGFSSTVFRFIDGMAHLKAFTPTTPEADEILRSTFPRPAADFLPFRMTQAGEVMQIPDTETLSDEIGDIARARGFRSMLFAPLMNKGASIGFIAVTRLETGAFADHHVQLLKTFSDQAVIAIENARLFDEVQAKTRDLEESLQQQTATADVLKVISRSPDKLKPVLDVIAETSRELCNAFTAVMFLLRDERFHVVAESSSKPEYIDAIRANPISLNQKGSILARAARQKRTVHIPNSAEDPEAGLGGPLDFGGPRSLISVPLILDGRVIGGITLQHARLAPFTDRQIEAIETFADQAVIAISNVNLFEQVQAKTRDLEESLQQQTATADVLKVISRSAFDLQTVLDTLLESAVRLSDARLGALFRLDHGLLHVAAQRNFDDRQRKLLLAKYPMPPNRGHMSGRALLTGAAIQIPDILSDSEYQSAEAKEAGFRSLLGVPLLRNGEAIGSIVIFRTEVGPFTQKQLQLIQTFADQAVIAIENVRLFNEVQTRTTELAQSLDELRTAQDRLVQTEKLASLGQLTAGIAHEIKNPLNFVNNFAALSAELTDELKSSLKPAVLDETIRAEVDEITAMLKDNLSKVVQHGRRADSIVKNMLLHSREGSGELRSADINAIVEESLNLAYHGARAEKSGFNITLKRDLDPAAGMVEVFPQEITRVFLNLISNGFYATSKRRAESADTGFEPVLIARTRDLGKAVEIRIRDNGTGIPPEVREKIFNPFFTTKPAGEGTGLGLSMTHDIIVKQHRGRIDVETEPGSFTEFIITLPRHNGHTAGQKLE